MERITDVIFICKDIYILNSSIHVKLNNNNTNFQHLLQHFVYSGVTDSKKLSDRDCQTAEADSNPTKTAKYRHSSSC